MSRPKRIGASTALATLPGWSSTEGRDAIFRSYKFDSFGEAFAWMARVALAAEKLDHHPEWSNLYSRVDVTLSTHDAGGVTELDIALAKIMDTAARL